MVLDKSSFLNQQIESLTKTGTWELDLVENKLSWSDGAFQMLGYKPQEFDVTFEKGLEVIHPEDRERGTALMEDVLKNDAEYFIEKRLLTKTGNIIHVRIKANLFKDEKGEPISLIGVFQDISEFVQSKNQLEEQHSFTKDIIQNLPSVFFLFNQKGQQLLWNKQYEEITGYNHEEIASMHPTDLFEGEEKTKIVEEINKVFDVGYTEVEAWINSKKSKKIPIFFKASIISYKGERCVFGTGTDISQRLSLLHELELLISNTDEAFMYIDQELNVVSYNNQMKTHYDLVFQKELKKGLKLTNLRRNDQKEELDQIIKQVWNKEQVKVILKVALEGGTEYYELKFKPILSEGEKVEGVFLTSLNVTETHRTNVALKESQQKLQQVLDSSLDTLCTMDEMGNFQMVSQSSEQLWGYKPEEMEGKPFMDFLIEEDIELTKKAAIDIKEGKQYRNFENRYKHKKGHVVPVVWSAYWDEEQKLMNCVARDATDKLKAEEQLKFSEKRFKSLVQEGGDLIGILDLEANYKYVSPTSSTILGMEPHEFLGNNAFDFIHPEDTEWVMKEFEKLEKEKHVQLPPFRFKHKNGGWRWLESSISNLLHEPSVQGIVANSRDVTETIELQQTVENATKLAKVGGWELNQITEEHFWSPMTKKIHEVPDDFVPNLEEAINFYHPNYQRKVEQAVEKAIEEGEPFDFEAIIITYKGNEKWVRVIGSAEMSDGKCGRIYGSFQDIHERKVIELRFKNISNNIPGVIIQFHLKPNGDDLMNFVSKRSEQIFGYSPEECVQNNELIWKNIEAGGDLSHMKETIMKSANNLSDWHASWRYQHPDGNIYWHEGYGHPMKKPDGAILWDSIIVDITEKKKVEEQIKLANLALEKHARELEISNAELEQFAYVASHDLQEPLRMVSSFLTQLEKKYGNQLDDKANQYINFAVDGAKRMRQIILDLLDYSKIGKKEEGNTVVDLNEVIQEVCLLHRKQIEELNANIEFSKLPKIYGHPSPLIQLFQNLISNSLKYSHPEIPPKVIINATELDNEWRFSVKDNGIGIEEEYFEKIFNIFQRLHNKNDYSGTGMGLAIVKKIVENLNGHIWVQSDLGKGSTFYFTIPNTEE